MEKTKKRTRSPLEGLAKSGTKLVPPTADQKERMELVRECRALAEVLHDDYKVWDVGITEHADGTFSCERYSCRDERYVSLGFLGDVKLSTWETSHHNGDPYGEVTRDLEPAEAKQELVHLRDSLQRRAVEAEKERLKQAAARREDDQALKNVRARLKPF